MIPGWSQHGRTWDPHGQHGSYFRFGHYRGWMRLHLWFNDVWEYKYLGKYRAGMLLESQELRFGEYYVWLRWDFWLFVFRQGTSWPRYETFQALLWAAWYGSHACGACQCILFVSNGSKTIRTNAAKVLYCANQSRYYIVPTRLGITCSWHLPVVASSPLLSILQLGSLFEPIDVSCRLHF